MKRRKRDENLKKEVGKRIQKLIGNMTAKDFAATIENIVDGSTIWTYINGVTLPDSEVQLKIAEKYGVTIDWILRGNKSPIPKNEQEKKFLEYYREAKELNVADKIEHFTKYTIDEAKREKSAKTTSKAA